MLAAEIKRIALDANIYKLGLADYPAARRAYARRKELLRALEWIRKQ